MTGEAWRAELIGRAGVLPAHWYAPFPELSPEQQWLWEMLARLVDDER